MVIKCVVEIFHTAVYLNTIANESNIGPGPAAETGSLMGKNYNVERYFQIFQDLVGYATSEAMELIRQVKKHILLSCGIISSDTFA